jgi:hypothetical protein
MQVAIQDDDLDAVDQAIIARLRKGPATARELLQAVAGQGEKISQPTLSRRLVRLAGLHHVVVRGGGKFVRYERDPYHDWRSIPPSRRNKVAYDFGRLAGYKPNVTRWLNEEERAQLQAAGGGRRLEAGTYSRAIAQKLLVDLSYASSALEGNTYSYLDTQVLIEFGQAAEGKALEETQMILNHKEAITYLIDNIASIDITVRNIKTLHALLARNLLDAAAVGSVRTTPVDITGSAYVPMSIPQKLEEELIAIADKAREIGNPFEQSLFLLAFISYLQAFRDVNKRTGRLACNIPLLKNGLAPFSFLDVDKTGYVEGLLAFYELGRIDLLKDVFVAGYVASAARYDAYAGRDRAAIELEFRRREDIYAAVRAYVERSVAGGARLDAERFAREFFGEDPEELRPKLAERVREIVAALQEGNHIAYGIPRLLFDAYQQLPAG